MMYWIYLILLVFAVLTPVLVKDGYFVLPEEELEGCIVLALGMMGFLIYFAKEKTVFRLLKERLSLQKVAHSIQRDLSESYVYIGSINRKREIVKELLFDLSVRTAQDSQYCILWYRRILLTVLELARVDAATLRLVDVHKRILLNHYEEGSYGNERYIQLTPDVLLAHEKLFFEREGCFIVRSPRLSGGIAAFFAIPKQINHLEDIDSFEMLAAISLLLYSLSFQNSYSIYYANRH